MRRISFLSLWSLAVIAITAVLVFRLALRGQLVSSGYELGRARAEQGRLREVKRVLEVEAASYKTPERVEILSRSILDMDSPKVDRIIPVNMRHESSSGIAEAAVGATP